MNETHDLLRTIKVACPRFSLPGDDKDLQTLVGIWCRSLNVDMNYPAFVYQAAVDSYFATASRDDNAPMPGDIRRHCKRVVERLEVDPIQGPKLREWRESRDRDRELRVVGT